MRTENSTYNRVWAGDCAAGVREKYMPMWFGFQSSLGLTWLPHGTSFLLVTKMCFGTSGRC